MRKQIPVSFEIRDVVHADRDPREMSSEALGQAQLRHFPPVPIRARETGRQIAALGLDRELPPNDPDEGLLPGKSIGQGSRDAADHNIPFAFDYAPWPFRLGKSPWRSPLSAEARAERAEQMRRNRISVSSDPDKTLGEKGTHGFDGSVVPSDPSDDFSQIILGSNPEDAK
jgi:hypothetical protein